MCRTEHEANVAIAAQRANPTPGWLKPSRCVILRKSPRRRSWFGRFLYIYFGI